MKTIRLFSLELGRLLRSRLTEATAFLLDYCNRRWPKRVRDGGADFLDAEFAL